MNQKTIVLGDNSYTIRRIVELSFSDEKEIRLLTFENGLNIKEKLLELQPQIVLVDIKLPSLNGYEVCRFIQTTKELQHTKIFLLKGGFEPIEKNLLGDLIYEDIITKPFDSNALVSNIKKLLEKMSTITPPTLAPEIPSSLPEDEELPEIEAIPDPEPEEDINFSDIKAEIESDEILTNEDVLIKGPMAFSDDEILPSEEITRAQPDKDSISPAFDDVEENPFEEELPTTSMKDKENSDSFTDEEIRIKQNIEMQEKELEINSLTMEEMNIKENIQFQEQQRLSQGNAFDSDLDEIMPQDKETEEDTSEMFPKSSLDSSGLTEPEISEEQEDLFSFQEQSPPAFEAEEELFSQEPDESDELRDQEIPEIKYEQEINREILVERELQTPEDIISPERVQIKEESLGKEFSQLDDIKIESELEFQQKPSDFDNVREYEVPEIEIPPTPKEVIPQEPDFKIPPTPKEVTPQEPDFKIPPTPPTIDKETAIPPEIEKTRLEIPPTPEIEETHVEIPQTPEIEETYVEIPQTPKIEETHVEIPPTPKIEETPLEVPPLQEREQLKEKIIAPTEIPHKEIFNKIEDKLTLAIKQILWEIIPPLAEKIIKEEIETLKAETEKANK